MAGKYQQMLQPSAPPAAAAPAGSKYMQMLDGAQPAPQGDYQPFAGPRQYEAGLTGAASPASQAVASFADDPESKIRYYAKRRGLPVERYGQVAGNIVYLGEDGKLHAEEPDTTLDPRTWLHQVSRWSGDALPTAAGAAGAVAGTLTGGPLLGAAGAMAGSAGGEAARQWVGKEVLGDPFSVTDVALQGAFGAAGEFGGMLIARGLSSSAARKAADRVRDLMRHGGTSKVEALRQAARDVGIDLTPAELTNLTRLRGEQRALSALPDSAGIMDDFYARRGGQIQGAVEDYAGRLSPVDNPEVAGEFGRGMAKEAIAKVAKNRSDQARPLYKQAYDANQMVESPLISKILETPAGKEALVGARTKMLNDMTLLSKMDPELTALARDMAEMGRMDPVKGGVGRGFKLRTMDYVKRSLDDQIEAAQRAGRSDDARILGDLKRSFVKELDHLDVTDLGTGGAYKKARAIYGDLSGGVSRVEGGVLAGVTKTKDPRLGELSYKLFATAGPRSIAEARGRALAVPGGQEAWDANLRAYLESTFTEASKTAMSNVGKPQIAMASSGTRWWASLFGDLKQQARLKAAMSQQQFTGLKKLMEVLEATGRALDFNSDTAFKQEAIRNLKRTSGGGLVGGTTAALDPANAVRLYMPMLNGLYKDFRFGKNVELLAKVITSPDALEQLSRIRQMSPTSKQAIIGAATALGIVAKEGGEGVLAPSPTQLPLSYDPGGALPSLQPSRSP